MLRLSMVFVVLAACGSDTPATRPLEFGGARPAYLKPPVPFVEGEHYPLLMILHGQGASGFVQQAFFQASTIADKAFVIAPDGTVDSLGRQFWNADPACCDIDNTMVDDSGYLSQMLTDITTGWPMIDQVFLEGHSNGGFMAYRMACDHADQISAIVSLAGDAASTPSACKPTQAVNILHLHGTGDDMVPFAGAEASTSQWAVHDGCGTTRTPGRVLDLDATVDGSETSTATIDGCPADTTVEQWTLTGAGHLPNFGPTVGATLFEWLDAHRRP